MHPHMFDAQFHALLNNLFCYGRTGKNEDCVRLLGYRLQIRITWCTIICGKARVDPVDLIASFLELFIAQVTACLAFIRYADNRDLFLCEAVLHKIITFCHWNSPYP